MNKTRSILWALLGAQIGLCALVYQKHFRGQGNDVPTLLGLKSDGFDRVVVSDPSGAKLTIAKMGDEWILPDKWNFPASKEKWGSTIAKMIDFKSAWPVGDTASARKRCKVEDNSFEKKVEFFRGDKELKSLLLGTSPEYRKVHVRASDRGDVHMMEFGFYELSLSATEWENKQFLSLDRNTLMSIETPSLHITNKDDGWQLTSPKAGQNAKPAEVETLVSLMTNLTFSDVVGTEALPEYGLSSPALSVVVRTKDGQTTTYSFGKPKAGGDDYYLKSSQHNFVFRVNKSSLTSLGLK